MTSTATPATLTARGVTALLRAHGLNVTSRTITSGAVRVSVNGYPGVDAEEAAARAAVAVLLQNGYNAARNGARVTVTPPEPVAPTMPTDEDDSPCAVCGEDMPADRPGWTCSDECAELYSEPGTLPTLVVADPYDEAVHLVVTEAGEQVGGVGLQDDGTYTATVDDDGEWWGEGFTTRRDAVLAVVRRQRELDDEHPRDCACAVCFPIEAADVFVEGERVAHRSGSVGTVVVGTRRGDVHVDDLWVTVAWDGDDTERHHPSTLIRGGVPPMRCAECDAVIVVTVDSHGAKSECGGEGEGVCDGYVDGLPAARASHDEAIARALRAGR